MFAAAMMMKAATGGGAADPDALAWIAAVEAADGQPLEGGVGAAVDAFVTGLKDDGIWTQIDQCAILVGARTLAGALVPLKGAAVANVNFVRADYDRATGIKGDGATKSLTAAAPAYTRTDAHVTVWVSEVPVLGAGEAFIGNTPTIAGGSQLHAASTQSFPRVNWSGTSAINEVLTSTGLFGASRASANTVDYILNGAAASFANNSAVVVEHGFNVFARGAAGNPMAHTDARLAWFSHGRAITLGNLAERLDALMDDLAAMIP